MAFMSDLTASLAGKPGFAVSPVILNLGVATFIMAAYNNTFWARGAEIFADKPVDFALFGASVWALTLLTVTFWGFRWLQKPVIIFLLITCAVTSYYMDSLGVMIDRDMIQNAVTTTFTETKHLITPAFVGHVFLWGVVPSVVVLLIPLRRFGLLRDLGIWALGVITSFAMFAGFLFSDYQAFSAILRERGELIGSYQPGAPIGGVVQYVDMLRKTRSLVAEPYGRDAVKGPLLQGAGKPVVTVIVVGETARAQDFGLSGYARNTTPELAKLPVVAFRDVNSCGTATAISMPCMFSHLGHDDYSQAAAYGSENLLDIFVTAGLDVEWWDNNTGHLNIAERIAKTQKVTNTVNAEFCASGECIDGIYLNMLKERLAGITKDTVLVIHQIGSHGPAYHLRYPKGFGTFQPACETAEFGKCTNEQIVNAYDNTILYTDYILSQFIGMLNANDKIIPALFYASDHGESLGENGLFLHGAPYFMAPEYQTKVPMVLWLSDRFKAAMKIDQPCLQAKTGETTSHDIIFHSMLGMMDIATKVRHDDLDIFSDCRVSL